ncbi:cytochrome P450 [Xylona heveae TC161]|uniref:Cytochrome P450 n=1 Tax=Xylona heveae (strain CBS 132557 / TC161) TaxID=1328760 RepID=A0A165HWN1_XYLHT|nr:cytochrome P450 [Xylona heveae TC161]KZF24030.1 cytochrome P450 [Xylona heveae TC161]
MEIWIWLLVALSIALCPIIYNVFFHPLRRFPGPRMAGATSWWKAYKEVFQQETLAQLLFDLHRKHGDIVRIGPNELHFGKPSAFHDIYHGTNRWDKDEGLYRTPGVRSGSFVFLKYKDAKERREVLQPMFSKRSIQNVEGLVWRNANRLATAVTKANAENCSIDLLYAFRSFTLDTIMYFTFGNCVDALDAQAFSDPLIVAMDASLRALPILKNFPLIRKVAYSLPPSLIMKTLPDAERLAPRIYRVRAIIEEQLQKVLDNPEKLDEALHQTIFHRMLDPNAHRSKVVPDSVKLHDEGLTLVFAGANTVADTLLMGHWNLLNQPDLVARLKAEVFSVWPDLEAQPNLKDLEALPLLTATIKESLRHIPSGVSLTRVVPPTGAVISGQTIPGGTTVGMAILHVHQSEEIFEDALSFKPERWLGEDAKQLEQWLVPFSRGPRMCFGVNLAWCELYIAFATLIRRFDMALDGTTAADMEWRECIAAYYPNRHLHAWCQPVEC